MCDTMGVARYKGKSVDAPASSTQFLEQRSTPNERTSCPDDAWRGSTQPKLHSAYFSDVAKKYNDMPLLLDEIKNQTDDSCDISSSVADLELLLENWFSETLHRFTQDERVAIRVMLFILYDMQRNGRDRELGASDASMIRSDWFVGSVMGRSTSNARINALVALFSVIEDKRNQEDVRRLAETLADSIE